VANCPKSRAGKARAPDLPDACGAALALPLQRTFYRDPGGVAEQGLTFSRVENGGIWPRPSRETHGQEASMNSDVFGGWWKQARGQAKSWWGQLTDDDLDRIEGEADKLVGALQTRYGWSREEAEREIDRRMGRAA